MAERMADLANSFIAVSKIDHCISFMEQDEDAKSDYHSLPDSDSISKLNRLGKSLFKSSDFCLLGKDVRIK